MLKFDWEGRGVLLTGGTGFIGGSLANEVSRRKSRLVLLVRDMDRQREAIHPDLWNSAIVVRGDLGDRQLITRILGDYEIETIYHLAAQAAVGTGLVDPIGTFESNITGTWNILEAARSIGSVGRIIVASSDKSYGEQKDLPYKEDTSPLLGLYPYDASKAAADIIARSYQHTYGLPIAVTRNANTYGGGDLDVRRLIPGVIHSALSGVKPIIRSDGSPERDYVYIKDAVDSYIMLAEQMDNEALHGQAFNFGSGVPTSVLEIVNKIVELIDPTLKPDVKGKAQSELSRQFVSIDKAFELFGWKPNYSLVEGLKETIDWYRAHFHLVRSWQGATK